MEYQLRAELRGHEDDVRGLCVCELGLVTVSRDKTAKLWTEVGNNAYECASTLIGHSSFVTAVTYLPPGVSQSLPQGALVTGSRDATVRLWDVAAGAQLQILEGHTYQVTDVTVGSGGSIVSCSLDATIRVWQAGDGKCVQVLEGHEGPVQCVVQLPGDGSPLLSGSNDRTVKVWQGGTCSATIQAHGDTVRGMALVPDIGIVTASHDQTAKVWTASGDLIAELAGHSALLYKAAASPDGSMLATASEDNTVKVWQLDGTCVQTIEHPACVWDVAFLPNGDLVSACADYVARVWTRDTARLADQEVREAFASSIAARKQAAAGAGGSGGGGLPSGINLEEPSALLAPGTKDGQTKIVREGGGAMAYSWSATSGQWEKIGEVVGEGGGGDTLTPGNKLFNGQAYDFVFDVDVEDGVPPRKLPINRGDNPYDAADKFLAREGLPQTYREQVVQFILQNTEGTVGMPEVAIGNFDPFTGAGAYVPRGNTAGGGSQPGAFSDPYTGAGAYVPPPQGSTQGGPSAAASRACVQPVTGGGVDPFTGSSSRPVAQLSAAQHIPYRSCMVYDNLPKRDAMAGKLAEFSTALAAGEGGQELAIPADQAGVLDSLLSRALCGASASGPMPEPEASLLSRLLRWPAPHLFPALDLARLLALAPATVQQVQAMCGEWGGEAGTIGAALAAAAGPPEVPAAQLTALRLLASTVASPALRPWAVSCREAALDSYACCASSANKNIRQALATVLLNYSSQLAAGGQAAGQEAEAEGAMQVFSALTECLQAAPEDDAETQYRSIVGLGTLLACGGGAGLAEAGRALGLGQLLSAAAGQGQGKVAEAAAQALHLLGGS